MRALTVLVGLGALVLMGCNPTPLEIGQGGPVGDGGPIDMTPQFSAWFPITTSNKVDVLFMVDNSNSMSAMSAELTAKFNEFFTVFQTLTKNGQYADLQIGVVTSDYGAGSTGAPGCEPSPGGQQGRLQAIGAAAPNSCMPPKGANFIQYAFAANGMGANNLPANQDLVQTFTCMASVGAGGCGFEHQLESVYAALHNNLPENANFVRDDALLAVVFLTNEDDSSAPPDTDMFDKTKVMQFGFEDSYRQTRWGVECGTPSALTPYADSGGPLSNCIPATNPPGQEYDVHRYIDLFTQPSTNGGIKANPADVILFAIDAPAEPVQIILSNPGTPGGMPYVQCGQLNEGLNPPCVPVLQHSCQNQQSPVFFGDPAVRLDAVINAAQKHTIASICDDDYTGALQDLGNLIVSNMGGNSCVQGKLPDPSHPVCDVENVTTNQDGAVSTSVVPECTGATPEPTYPCWSAAVKATCSGVSPDGVGLTLNRNGVPLPDNTVTQYRCSTY